MTKSTACVSLALLTAACSGDESADSLCPLDQATTASGAAAATVQAQLLRDGVWFTTPLPVGDVQGSLAVYIGMPFPSRINGGIEIGQTFFQRSSSGLNTINPPPVGEEACAVCSVVGLPIEGSAGATLNLAGISGTFVLEYVDLTPGAGTINGSLQNARFGTRDEAAPCDVAVPSLTFDLLVVEGNTTL